MIRTERSLGGSVLVLGVVRGLASEVAPLLTALAEFAPRAVGIGASPDEVQGLNEYFVGTPTEPVVPLASSERAEIRGLTGFGDVRVPHPAYTSVLSWGRAQNVPVEAVDPSDESYADMFTDHIGYFELVRRTLRERKLTKSPPVAPTADAYAIEWARRMTAGPSSERFRHAREQSVAAQASKLASRYGRIALVIDRERYETLLDVLGPARTRPGAPRTNPAEKNC